MRKVTKRKYMSEMDRKRNRTHVETLCPICLNAAFVRTDGSEKNWKLQCCVYPEMKYCIGQASTMQSFLPCILSQP